MKSFFVFLLLILVCCCCKDDLPEYRDTFSFKEKTLIVNVTDTTRAFFIRGKIDRVYAEALNKDSEDLIVIPELTTAIQGEHYVLPDCMTMKFSEESLDDQIKISLLPANITQAISIVFTTRLKIMHKDYSKYIDTLTVKLIPVIQEK